LGAQEVSGFVEWEAVGMNEEVVVGVELVVSVVVCPAVALLGAWTAFSALAKIPDVLDVLDVLAALELVVLAAAEGAVADVEEREEGCDEENAGNVAAL
jgi:hypothetical protein